MEPFASPEQMEQRTLGAITATTHPFLANELRSASLAIRNACHWHVAPQLPLTYRRVGAYAEQVWLPAMEIEAIDGGTVDGRALDPSTVEFDPSTGWTNITGRSVTIEYRAGFRETPDDLIALTLELAAGALGSPLGITREQSGGVSVTLSRAGGGITASDELRLIQYRIGSLP